VLRSRCSEGLLYNLGEKNSLRGVDKINLILEGPHEIRRFRGRKKRGNGKRLTHGGKKWVRK